MAHEISNSDSMIDSRDIIARIEELEGAMTEGGITDDENDELAALMDLRDEADGSPDWLHGETLIRDSYFQEFAEEFADDIGAIDRNANWPLNHIDWEGAAEALKEDYTSVEFDGVTYWIRS